jgi:putative ABC transport system permease protein
MGMSLLQDVRFALRLLLKDRWFSGVAITALALGIGVNATVFTLVNAVLIRGLPFPEADRLYVLGVRPATATNFGEPISRPDLLDWRAGTTSYEGLAAFVRSSMTVSDARTAPEDTPGVWATANTFDLLRQPMLLGRGFRRGDDEPGSERVVILGHALWQSRYRGDRGVLGLPVRINGEPATVVGVMPPGIKFPSNAELWVSAIPTAEQQRRRDIRNLTVFARLKPGVQAAQARAELDGVVKRLAKAHPASNKELTVGVLATFNERFNGGQVRTVFLTLMGAVGFVLLIACANVANLLLSRSTARAREVAVRYAMGATRWRVVRQLLVESLLLATAGGIIGLGIAVIGTRLFDRAVADVGKPYWIQFTIDGVVIAYLVGICVVTSLVFGLAPAVQVARTSVGSILKQGGRGSTGSRQMRGFSSALVVLELALTLVLLVGAGLMGRSFMALNAMDTGIKNEHLIAMRVNLPRVTYDTAEKRALFFERLTPRLASLPGADNAAVSTSMPPFGLWEREVLVDGRADPGRGKRLDSGFVAVSPSFFETVGAPVLRGRPFDARDGAKGTEVAIVNQRFAARHFPGENPIGRRIRFPDEDPDDDVPWLTIVGVSQDIRHGNPRERDIPDVAYIPVRQLGPGGATVVLRSRLDPNSLVGAVRREVQLIDPDQAVGNPQTVDQILAQSAWPFRVFGTLFAVLAGIALTLASVGLYAVIAYSVSTRTQEIGVRMALGAGRTTVGWLVLRRGLWQLGIGLVLGLGGAWAVGKYVLASVVAQISGTDPAIFVGVPVLLTVVAVAACLIPARRASRLDPLDALRTE